MVVWDVHPLIWQQEFQMMATAAFYDYRSPFIDGTPQILFSGENPFLNLRFFKILQDSMST